MALTPCHVVFSALHLQTSQEPSKKTTIIICILQYQEFVSQKGYSFLRSYSQTFKQENSDP